MDDATKTARMRFFAALALYLLWVGALAAMAVLSSSKPPASRSRDSHVAAVAVLSDPGP